MPYDLYGTYYASERDALNAEMAQCAAIDAGIAERNAREAMEIAQANQRHDEEWKAQIEERLFFLERFYAVSLCEGECK